MRKTWEYRIEELSGVQTDNQLNFIGAEGWELVHVQYKGNAPAPYTCFFKRPKETSLL